MIEYPVLLIARKADPMFITQPSSNGKVAALLQMFSYSDQYLFRSYLSHGNIYDSHLQSLTVGSG